MATLEVFDRPMCCSTGICGPQVDPVLVRFAADLDWLRRQGVRCERFNLAQQPQQFMLHENVKAVLREGTENLPVLRVDGHIVAQGAYPNRQALAALCGVAVGGGELPIVDCGSAQGCC